MTQLHVIISPTTVEVKHLQPYTTIDKTQFYRLMVDKVQVNSGVIR